MTTDAYLLAAFRYIHQIDVVGVRSIDQYRWSSYRTYLRLRSAPPLLDTTLLDGMLGGPEAMRTFHEVQGMADLVREGADPVGTLRQLIDLAIGVVALDLEDQVLTARLDRTVIHLLDGIPGIDPAALAELRGTGRSTNANTLARRRAEDRLANDPAVERILRFIADQLAPSDEVRPQPTCRLGSDLNRPGGLQAGVSWGRLVRAARR
ncbi:MAG: hypothetical protein CL424_02540 [Acidimicrobiaceae bacterium]|nr:hypothetical protein [Acidimicrobiaceae bacterium]